MLLVFLNPVISQEKTKTTIHSSTIEFVVNTDEFVQNIDYQLFISNTIPFIVIKVSYTYKGTTVYDVRVPLALPAAGLEAGKYYKYIINIISIANGTNDPDEANDEKDDIDIVNNPIQVTVDITDYIEGYTQVIVI